MARTFSKRDERLRTQTPQPRAKDRPQRVTKPATAQRSARTPDAIQVIRETPVEVIRLVEDIQSLTLAQTLVGSVDALNIMDTNTQGERDTADELRRNTSNTLRNWQRYAEAKLRRDYL